MFIFDKLTNENKLSLTKGREIGDKYFLVFCLMCFPSVFARMIL